jgi:hypothetical protein
MFGDEIRRDVAAVPDKECLPSGIAGNTAEGIPGGGIHDPMGSAAGAEAAKPSGAPDIDPDSVVPHAASASGNGDFAAFATRLKMAHDAIAQSRFGGTISDAHDRVDSNLDRLWATWQRNSCS